METKRFDIITEADARRIDTGATVRLAAGGHITPLARDTLHERRVTVVRENGVPPEASAALVPAADVRRLVIGSDHTGVDLKKQLVGSLRTRGLAVIDVGTLDKTPVDYPDIAAAVGRAVIHGEADAGIVIDGSGLGSAIAANKLAGIRAVMCTTPTLARYAREHNGANVLALGSSLLAASDALAIVDTFIATPMREPRYIARLAKIRALEDFHG
jgi:ribose 5-phosphate isomerase B